MRRFVSRPWNFTRAVLCCAVVIGGIELRAQVLANPGALSLMADEYRAQTIRDDPAITFSVGLPPEDNGRFADRTEGALARRDDWKRELLRRLKSIEPASLSGGDRALYATLHEQLNSDLQLGVCRTELWNVNHFTGWQAILPIIAEGQPIDTEEERSQALARWSSLPGFVDTEIANLDRGLAEGYAAPKSVVHRVIAQLEALLPSELVPSPLSSPAMRSGDPAFEKAFSEVAEQSIVPAIRRYRNYLETDYLPKARDGIALADLPNGKACYRAMLRANTTLDRTPEEVFVLGQQTVESNLAAIRNIGERQFGTTDIDEIIRRVKVDPENLFPSEQELLDFTRARVAEAKIKTSALVTVLPRQDVIVEPESAADAAAGVSSHYDPNSDPSEVAIYKIQLAGWNTQTRGEATIVAVHETWPGHHLQIAFARERQPQNPLGDLVGNSAYIEGWARYAEALAEEVGIYAGEDARVLRRIWPARGMVVDPGLHIMGWSREKAVEYLVSTGRFDTRQAEDRIDRIAVLPGQLTSYDSGGLEILALRDQAQASLGSKFSLRSFNEAVLELGVIPLSALREHVEAWISRQKLHSVR